MFSSPWKSKVNFEEEKRINKLIGYDGTCKGNSPQKKAREIGYIKTSFGIVKLKPARASERIVSNSNAGVPKFLIEANDQNSQKVRRSYNSIEKELKEIECLKQLKSRDQVAFYKFLSPKKKIEDANQWYEQQMFYNHLTQTHVNNLHDLYDPVHTNSYTPEINPKSRWITQDYRNEFKETLHKSKSANKTVSMQTYKDQKNEKPKKKFNQVEFNNHLIKINDWNKTSNSNLFRNFVRNFNRRSETANKSDRHSKSASMVQLQKEKINHNIEYNNGTHVPDYFAKDFQKTSVHSRPTYNRSNKVTI
jgi:hypothetical protein